MEGAKGAKLSGRAALRAARPAAVARPRQPGVFLL